MTKGHDYQMVTITNCNNYWFENDSYQTATITRYKWKSPMAQFVLHSTMDLQTSHIQVALC